MFTVEPGYVKNTKFWNLLETAQLVGGGGGGLRLLRRRHGNTKLESNKTMTRRRSLDLGTITKCQQFQSTFSNNSRFQLACVPEYTRKCMVCNNLQKAVPWRPIIPRQVWRSVPVKII